MPRPFVIGLFVGLNFIESEKPGFDVAPRNEPRNLLSCRPNRIDPGFLELLVELRQSVSAA